MKKWEKEIVQKQINSEQQVIYRLQDSYKIAIEDVKSKIAVLQSREQTQSVIYQLKYQQELQKQLENIYSKMSQKWYSEIDKYLKECYEDSFFGTMYELHQEGIPIVIPFNQAAMAQAAAQSDFEGIKLSQKLYDDAIEMARISRQEITRGIATNQSWGEIARRVEKRGQTSLYNATRIVRTESHRINNEVKMKTIQAVKDEGADIVKQWDSTVDKRTRPHHVELDGQTREIEQPFKIASTGAQAMFPGGFGKAEEDIHCRCVMLQRARWALDKSEINKSVGDLRGATDAQLEAWAKKLGVSKDELIKASNGIIEADGTINHCIKAKNYNDFKKKYKTKAETETAKNQAQLDILEDEKKKLLSGLTEEQFKKKLESAMLGLSGDDYIQLGADWKKIQDADVKIADLKNKLGLNPPEPKTKPSKTTTNLSDFESFKKNAKTFKNEYDAYSYHENANFNRSKWDNDLTANERNGIRNYTGSNYREMNLSLRKDRWKSSYERENIEWCTAGLEKCTVADDVVLYRGMGGADALSMWTGIPVNQLSDEAVQQSLVGSRLTEKGFMSCGVTGGKAWSGIKLTVYVPKGSKGMYVDLISKNSGERELLLQRNSTFEVKEVKTDSHNGYIKELVLMLVEQTL